jgi:hypothetical protein
MSELITVLKENGWRNVKRQSGVQLRVLVDGNNASRISECEHLERHFKDIGANYVSNHSDSSIGAVIINKMRINVKPKSKQGSGSAGVENEHFIVNSINDMIEDIGNPDGIRIRFNQDKGSRKKTYKNIVKAKQVGADTKGRKKADIQLINNRGIKYPISLKKDNYDMLESADSYFKAKARKTINRLIKQGKVALVFLKKKTGRRGKYDVFQVKPNFAIQANAAEKRDVIFGSDILSGKGAVIVRTFRQTDFSYDGKDNMLNIKSSHVIAEMAHTGRVWFLVRNDSTRNATSTYPRCIDCMPAGTRIIANNESRIGRTILRVVR